MPRSCGWWDGTTATAVKGGRWLHGFWNSVLLLDLHSYTKESRPFRVKKAKQTYIQSFNNCMILGKSKGETRIQAFSSTLGQGDLWFWLFKTYPKLEADVFYWASPGMGNLGNHQNALHFDPVKKELQRRKVIDQVVMNPQSNSIHCFRQWILVPADKAVQFGVESGG